MDGIKDKESGGDLYKKMSKKFANVFKTPALPPVTFVNIGMWNHSS